MIEHEHAPASRDSTLYVAHQDAVIQRCGTCLFWRYVMETPSGTTTYGRWQAPQELYNSGAGGT